MLNTKKLLYILPDVAYIAELLPTKKEHTFAIQTFRQINGEFLDDNEFIPQNVAKLISKIEPEEYHLILPDFLFTNTIVEVRETTESKVEEYLKKHLLPSLALSADTHQIKTSTLAAYGGRSKVQLSALEKDVLEPLRAPFTEQQAKIVGVAPLSWTVKSLVSLEPSITIIQIGTKLYLALHYIGVDQCMTYDLNDFAAVGETIKTLKGGEPSIQTVYLLTNPLAEKNLKEILSGTLPIQQLTVKDEEMENLPAYVKQIIEAGLRTISIKDFPVPQFELGQSTGTSKAKSTSKSVSTAEETMPKDSTPDSADSVTETAKHKPKIETVEIFDDDEHELPDAADTDLDQALPKPVKVTPTDTDTDADQPAETRDEPTAVDQAAAASAPPASKATPAQPKSAMPEKKDQFGLKPGLPSFNRGGNYGQFLKMLFITVSVFFVTVGVGVGLGLGVLSLSGRGAQFEESPVVTESPQPSPVAASPSPSPIAEFDQTQVSVLVVNATTVAGQAGVVMRQLEAAKFSQADAGNAKGDYDPGFYVLISETAGYDDQAVIAKLKTVTKLEFEVDPDLKISLEDPQAKYDLVLVLADEVAPAAKEAASQTEEATAAAKNE